MKPAKISILFITTLIFSLLSCNENKDSDNKTFIYFCNAEHISKDKKYFTDKNIPKIKFGNAEIQSSEKSFSGKYSVKTDSAHKFGMTFELKNVKPEEKYKISVVRYKNPQAYLIITDGENYYRKFGEKNLKKTSKKDWFLIERKIQIPKNFKSGKLSIYVWNTSSEPAYFDDLKIEKLPEYENFNFKQKALYLYIDKAEMQKLEKIRQEAFRKGILETTDDSWVKAAMFYNNDDYKVKLRFKGDWLDHLEGKKWSFRIKVKKGKTWKGMKTFSIQNPKSRHFLDEWTAHKIFEQEDVLTTRYEFIPVYLNNKPLGLYAYEDHFEKQLVESQKRREGVILKFSEDQFWATYNVSGTTDIMPVFEASDILPFKLNKTLKSNVLKNQFLIAQNLLFEYKNNLKKANEIFDIKKVAKYYAIITLTKMNHSIRWHNMRFYYNPVISKLEPIAFDGYTPDGFMAWGGNIFGNFTVKEAEHTKIENRPNYFIFTDSLFRNEYLKELEKICTDSFLNSIFSKNNKKIHFYESELRQEFPEYVYDTTFLYNNAKKIRHDLNIYKLRINEGKYDKINFKTDDKKRYTGKYYEKLIPLFINAFTENKNNSLKTVKVENYLPYSVNIIGFAETDLFVSEDIAPKKINKYEKTFLKTKNPAIKYVCVKIPDKNRIFFIHIFPFPAPATTTPLQELISNNNLPKYSDNRIIFQKGKYTIDKTIIIPPEKEVIFEPGANIDIINNAAFISYSPVNIKGDTKQKVIIQSSDSTAQGFTILQSEQKSDFRNAVFKNLNTLNYKGWILTGGVTLYESDVNINNCEFINNKCEDALNIVRSDFYVSDCKFENIYSDAFDSDFCTGKLQNTNFNNIGNDAIDFSGSKISITNCNIHNANDKGISGGEISDLAINKCIISDSNIGIAAKDLTNLTVKDCNINNCKYGFVAFQKKPEYGPGKIIAEKTELNGIINPYLIEKKSVLILNHKKIEGFDKKTAKKFY